VGTGYDILLSLHLLCVVGGFGYLAYSGLTLILGRRRGASIGTLEVTLQISTLAELLVYGAFVFGIAAVGSSHVWKFSQTWVSAALALYLVDVAILHAVIRRSQREYVGLARALATTAAPIPGRPPEVDRIEALERRIALGWGGFNVIAVVVVFLMVFQPGA
jgi:uncharacterized membrane protein